MFTVGLFSGLSWLLRLLLGSGNPEEGKLCLKQCEGRNERGGSELLITVRFFLFISV